MIELKKSEDTYCSICARHEDRNHRGEHITYHDLIFQINDNYSTSTHICNICLIELINKGAEHLLMEG